MKTVTIQRLPDNGIETMGILTTPGFTCRTLELPWLDNKSMVSCIPKGTYTCIYTMSPKFKKKTYELQSVPKRSGIRIHSGNYASAKKSDVEGCILLGTGYSDINGDKVKDIVNSAVTIKAFEQFLKGENFTLIII